MNKKYITLEIKKQKLCPIEKNYIQLNFLFIIYVHNIINKKNNNNYIDFKNC